MKVVPCRSLIPLIGLGLLFVVPVVAQQKPVEWLQFRGPGGSGISPATNLPTTWSARENIVWKTDLPGPGTSSPIFVGDKIVLTCYSGYNVPGKAGDDMAALKRHLVCLDSSGKELWNTAVAAALPEQARIRDDHGYASSTPVADAERIYAFFGKSGVFAFDHSGKQLWQAAVGTTLHGWGSAASPILYKDLVLVNASVESESLVALDRKTGKEVWRATGIKESWATPLLVPLAGGKTELVVPVLGKLFGFDPDSGKQLWTCATDISWYMVPSLVAGEGIVYAIGGRSGGALAVRCGGTGNVTATHRLWTGNKGSNVSSPILHAGHLYWAHESNGTVYCAEAATGRILYEERLPRAGQFYAAALLADGKLLYMARDGKTFVVPVGPKFELAAVNDLGERSTFNATPVAVGQRLYLRSDRSLFCIGKK